MAREPSALPKYEFAENDWEFGLGERPKAPDERGFRKQFTDCIGYEDAQGDDDLNGVIDEFVAVTHMSAWWFNARMHAAFRMRWMWFGVSLLGLLGILVLAYVLPLYVYPDDMSTPQAVSAVGANVTLLLTGVVLVFRTINSWVNSYASISHYWKGRSALLDLIYTVQTEFRGKDFSKDEAREALKTELKTKIGEARAATKDAMDDIITSLEAPELDLDSLTTAQGSASSLFSTFFNTGLTARSEQIEARIAARAAKEARDALPSEIAALEGSIAEGELRLLQLLGLIKAPEIPDDLSDVQEIRDHVIEGYNMERTALQEQLASWKTDLAEKKRQLATA